MLFHAEQKTEKTGVCCPKKWRASSAKVRKSNCIELESMKIIVRGPGGEKSVRCGSVERRSSYVAGAARDCLLSTTIAVKQADTRPIFSFIAVTVFAAFLTGFRI